jgi:lipoyl(octanoyl) transferase
MNKKLTYSDLGTIDYKDAWNLQKNLLNSRHKNEIDDILLLLEHPHTYTLGKTADRNNLIAQDQFLDQNKISVYDIDRGGDITYHGPGQIVGYPIIDLTNWKKDTHKYLRAIEEVVIKTCAEYNIVASRNQEFTGVWVGDKKIAAIGIKVSRWITMHGFAFNINTDLTLFEGIIPCGIKEKSVTSLQKELGKMIDINEVKSIILKNFTEVFEYSLTENKDPEEILISEIIDQ